MTDHKSRLWLKDLFDSLPSGAKTEFKSKTGIDPDNAPPWLLKGCIEASIETETTDRRHEREDQIRRDQYEFQAKLEQAKAEALRVSLNEAAKIIREGNSKDAQRLEQILNSIDKGCKQLPSGAYTQGSLPAGKENYLPSPFINYLDCPRNYRQDKNHPEGGPGPTKCIEARPYPDGVHYRCVVAFFAQSPDVSVRTKYQIFHAESLRDKCPRPYSRSITHRIPWRISWLFARTDICPLADGAEYVRNPEGRFIKIPETFQPPTIGKDTWR